MINSVILQGRLTAAPELRRTSSDISVCSFAVACSNGSGDDKKTDFINCIAWRSTADFVSKYFDKGDLIAIDGRITSRSYTDKNGDKRYVTEVVVNSVHFCGNKK